MSNKAYTYEQKRSFDCCVHISQIMFADLLGREFFEKYGTERKETKFNGKSFCRKKINNKVRGLRKIFRRDIYEKFIEPKDFKAVDYNGENCRCLHEEDYNESEALFLNFDDIYPVSDSFKHLPFVFKDKKYEYDKGIHKNFVDNMEGSKEHILILKCVLERCKKAKEFLLINNKEHGLFKKFIKTIDRYIEKVNKKIQEIQENKIEYIKDNKIKGDEEMILFNDENDENDEKLMKLIAKGFVYKQSNKRIRIYLDKRHIDLIKEISSKYDIKFNKEIKENNKFLIPSEFIENFTKKSFNRKYSYSSNKRISANKEKIIEDFYEENEEKMKKRLAEAAIAWHLENKEGSWNEQKNFIVKEYNIKNKNKDDKPGYLLQIHKKNIIKYLSEQKEFCGNLFKDIYRRFENSGCDWNNSLITDGDREKISKSLNLEINCNKNSEKIESYFPDNKKSEETNNKNHEENIVEETTNVFSDYFINDKDPEIRKSAIMEKIEKERYEREKERYERETEKYERAIDAGLDKKEALKYATGK